MRRILLCLAVAVVTWNVVFDRLVQAGEKHYLALQASHAPGVSIRAVMEPAIHHAATTATLCAAAAAALTALLLLAIRRLSVATSSSPSAPVSSRPAIRP